MCHNNFKKVGKHVECLSGSGKGRIPPWLNEFRLIKEAS